MWKFTSLPQNTHDSFPASDFGSQAENDRRHSGHVNMM
jgi:hypothetical protein